MQSYSKIWLHVIWATNDRMRVLTKAVQSKLSAHFKEYGTENEIHIDTANGGLDHVHLLLGMKPTQTPAELINLLKGESSNWLNKTELIQGKFSWQRGYSAFSLGESQIKKVREYIKNQSEHHRRKSYQEEVTEFLKLYGVTP